MMAAVAAARRGLRVCICERSSSPGRKLLASGGERCNLSNTLSSEDFMERFHPQGRFMGPALKRLGGDNLRQFFSDIGVQTVVHDGFRVWPETRKSSSVLAALLKLLEELGVDIERECHVRSTEFVEGEFRVQHAGGTFRSRHLILATGGLALPGSGASGEGYGFAESFGHTCSPRFPAGVPLVSVEDWTARCTAHTIGKAELQVDMRKHARVAAKGDLIFTKQGIRGPVVLDLSHSLSPLLEKYGQVPLVMNLCRGRNQEQWQQIFKAWRKQANAPLLDQLQEHLPRELCEVMCDLAQLPADLSVHGLGGQDRDNLIRVMVKTPLTISGTTGYDAAFVTRGGVRLKQVRPDTLESKQQPGLYLCGELLDLDGPCGGFNLQWAFASGHLAGSSAG